MTSNLGSQDNTRDDSGMVLVIVLWWLVFLLLLLTHVTAVGRTEIQTSGNILGGAIAEAAADGAVNDAIFQTLAHRWRADGAAHLVRGVGTVASVRIDDEASRIDPNVTPGALMAALLRVCGASPKAAEQLALSIAEWRSLDTLRTAANDNAPQYRAAGFPYIPPHKRFVSKDELGLVLGMNPELLACLSPHISVYALSVPSLGTTDDQVIRKALAAAYPDDVVQAAAIPVREEEVLRITAVAQTATGAQYRRVAVVRIGAAAANDNVACKILSWEGNGDGG